jgi:glycine/D-amino acid oxidase-like deaminating enzyme
MKQKPKIVVIGSGIVGASIAMSCLNLGADVVVLERDNLGGSASSKSFGWINASFAKSTDYFKLRNAAVDTFRNLTKEINLNNCVQWQGTLWWEDSGQELERQFNKLMDRGYSAKILDKNEIKSLEPNLKDIPKEAIFTSLEGAADADRVALEMLKQLAKKGGKVLSGCTVLGLKVKKSRVSAVQTNIGDMQCDMVAIATGAATQKGLEGLEWRLPMQNKNGLIVQTAPLPQLINHVLMTNDVHFKQNADGSLTAGEIFSGDLKEVMVPLDVASDIVSRISKKLNFTGNLIPENIRIGVRPIPIDGFPVVGDIQGYKGLFIAVMHSGVTLAPLIGQLLASEMLQSTESPLLKSFKPSRFAE